MKKILTNINIIKKGCSSPLFLKIFLFFMLIQFNLIWSQEQFVSYGRGVNMSIEKVILNSIENFFEIYNVSLDKDQIIEDIDEEYFRHEVIFDKIIDNKNLIIVKSTFLDEDKISQKNSFLNLEHIQSLIDKTLITKEISNDLFNEYVKTLEIKDVFNFSYELENKSINSNKQEISFEVKNRVSLNPNFTNIIDNLIFVLNEMKLSKKEIDLAYQNKLDLYPVFMITENSYIMGLFLNNDIQYNLQILIDRIFNFLRTHKIKDNLGNVYSANSYELGSSNFFQTYINNKWVSIDFEKNKILEKSVGFNYLESESKNSLVQYFYKSILKESYCFFSTEYSFEDILMGKEKFKLVFPNDILSLKCSINNSVINYYYKITLSLSESKKLNSEYEVLIEK